MVYKLKELSEKLVLKQSRQKPKYSPVSRPLKKLVIGLQGP